MEKLSPISALGEIIAGDSSGNAAKISGPTADGQILMANSAATGGLVWSTVGGPGGGSVTSTELSAVSAAAADAISAVSNAVSIVSEAQGVTSAAVTSVNAVVSNLTSAVQANSVVLTSSKETASVLAAGLGGVQMKVVAGAQSVSAAGLTKVSGLSASVVAAGVYQLDGFIIYSGSAKSVLGYGLSMETGTMANAAGQWRGNTNLGMTPISNQVSTGIYTEIAGYWNETGFGSVTFSAAVSTPVGNAMLRLTGLIAMSTTGGTVQVKAKAGGTGVITIKAGSYLRAYKIG